jgi:hypothetical protein
LQHNKLSITVGSARYGAVLVAEHSYTQHIAIRSIFSALPAFFQDSETLQNPLMHKSSVHAWAFACCRACNGTAAGATAAAAAAFSQGASVGQPESAAA